MYICNYRYVYVCIYIYSSCDLLLCPICTRALGSHVCVCVCHMNRRSMGFIGASKFVFLIYSNIKARERVCPAIEEKLKMSFSIPDLHF